MADLRSPNPLQLRRLHAEDEVVVRAWMGDFLRQHVRTWAEARRLGWTDREVDGQLLGTDLVETHTQQFLAAGRQGFVRLAQLDGRLVGGVWAVERMDAYLHVRGGVLNWIYVDRWARQHGVGRLLVRSAFDWMRGRGLDSVSVNVLTDNTAARALYASFGLVSADCRMMGNLEDDRG